MRELPNGYNETTCCAEGCGAVERTARPITLPVGWWAVAEALESKLIGLKNVLTFCPNHKPILPPIKGERHGG
jgi:hypothetical protein